MSEINCLITVILQWQRYALRERDKNGDRNRDRKSERETEKDREILLFHFTLLLFRFAKLQRYRPNLKL